jgi:DNA-binding NarL/FixJ family response regulator
MLRRAARRRPARCRGSTRLPTSLSCGAAAAAAEIAQRVRAVQRDGIDEFAARAERELLATGERVRTHTVETRGQLTARETQIARLARDVLSNAEIGARLFISQHTVAYHLRNVFSGLG